MTATDPLPSFGHYEIERLLGRGAMGVVYLARDRRIGRRVALKTITIAPEQIDDSTTPRDFYARLQREAEVSGSLVHPNIVTLYEAGYESERISYLAMEYVEGETLLARMNAAAPAPLDVDTAMRVIEDVLNGLAYAHGKGIVHRDIKPANVLITKDGSAKIADFGIARPQNSSLTAAGALMGTPNYMAPEQIQGHPLTAKADVFSTGVMLFEMLTAVKPFAGSDLTATLHNILRKQVPLASDLNAAVPRPVADLILRMVAKAPEARPSAAEVLADLQRFRTRSAIAPRMPERSRAKEWIAIAIAITVIGGAALAIAIALTHAAAQPTILISPPQMREFDEKRHALNEAEAAYEAGRYQESIAKYDAYLQKYPQSTAAIEGRQRAREALEKPKEAAPKPAKHHRRSRDEDISPSELLNRLKKVFKH